MSEFFEVVKQRTGLNGNQIAKAINESPELVSRWNTGKSEPNGKNTLKLMELAKIERDEAMKIMRNGFASVSLLVVTAVFMSLIYMNNFGVFTAVYTLYEITRAKITAFVHGLIRTFLTPLQVAFYSKTYRPI